MGGPPPGYLIALPAELGPALQLGGAPVLHMAGGAPSFGPDLRGGGHR